ncbi:MAG: hypothetical protein AVDCRST_MAG49-396, partial [uncultured Thermomicrobiales bacterium]
GGPRRGDLGLGPGGPATALRRRLRARAVPDSGRRRQRCRRAHGGPASRRGLARPRRVAARLPGPGARHGDRAGRRRRRPPGRVAGRAPGAQEQPGPPALRSPRLPGGGGNPDPPSDEIGRRARL